MDIPTLISFPLPMMTAFLSAAVAVLIWRVDIGIVRVNVIFSLLFALCAVEALLVGLRFGYDTNDFISLQRVLPLFLGPMIYLGFAAITVASYEFLKLVIVHLCLPFIIAGLFRVLFLDLRYLDWAIGASYLFYIVALILLWRKGSDALSYARIEVTGRLSNWILRAICLLTFILCLDAVIALDFAFNAGMNVPGLISYGTIPLVLVLLATLVTLPQALSRIGRKTQTLLPYDTADVETEKSLRALMVKNQLFLDPDLTVQRLAKRLHLPARSVSGAINRVCRMNTSQYVNEFRLEYAADLLIGSDHSVREIAEKSGFMTRSNFYREFQRVYGQSPTDYRSAARQNMTS